jgi:hypothetical protein
MKKAESLLLPFSMQADIQNPGSKEQMDDLFSFMNNCLKMTR